MLCKGGGVFQLPWTEEVREWGKRSETTVNKIGRQQQELTGAFRCNPVSITPIHARSCCPSTDLRKEFEMAHMG